MKITSMVVGCRAAVAVTIAMLVIGLVSGCARFREDPSEAKVSTPAQSSPPGARETAPEGEGEPAESESAAGAEEGMASWFGAEFEGKKTASGEVYDKEQMTAAHKTLPLGTKAKVTNVETGESVEVEINDRGPNVGGRIVDLSEGAAEKIGMKDEGVEKVKVEPVETPKE